MEFNPSPDIIHDQKTIYGSWVTSTWLMEELVERLVRWNLHPADLMTHRFRPGASCRRVCPDGFGEVRQSGGLLRRGADLEMSAKWEDILKERLPLYGHRNWIVIADSAYPAQSSDGVETIVSDGEQTAVLAMTFALLGESRHIKPTIYTDQELNFVSEADARGCYCLPEATRTAFERTERARPAARGDHFQAGPRRPDVPCAADQDQHAAFRILRYFLNWNADTGMPRQRSAFGPQSRAVMENGTLQNARSGLNSLFLKGVFNHESTLAAEAWTGIDRDFPDRINENAVKRLKNLNSLRSLVIQGIRERVALLERSSVHQANSRPEPGLVPAMSAAAVCFAPPMAGTC